MSDVRKTLERFGNQSVWGKSSDRLTIVRIDQDTILTPENAMVVDIFESRQTKFMPETIRTKAHSIAAGGPEALDKTNSSLCLR